MPLVHGSQSLASLRPNQSAVIIKTLRHATTQLSRLCIQNRPRPQPAHLELSSACSYPPLLYSTLASLLFFDVMASLVGLATALLWQIIFFVLLHNGSRTLADDMYLNDLCWYPNGQLSGLGWPCTDERSPSNCCPEGFVCMNTGVCKLKGHDYYERQSCTDRTWLDPSCSQMCLSGRSFVARFPLILIANAR